MTNTTPTSNILIYQSEDGHTKIETRLENETVWLNRNQLSDLFGRDVKTIGKHINNVFSDGELEELSTVAKFATVQNEGGREVSREIEYYNLDVIISVGYRVKSASGVKFRQWATKILKEYLINGYAINQKRLEQKGLQSLNDTIALLQDTISKSELELSEAKGLLDVILNYSRTWTLLQGYDEDSLHVNIASKVAKFILDVDEAKDAVVQLKKELIKKGEATELFGHEKAGEFGGMVRNIYQTFGGVDLLPSVEEKAANLLYYIIKGHPFNDGNKRIGAFMFILFLSKNNMLYKKSGELKINDNALVALSLMTAKSDPKQKETIIHLIANLLES